MLTHSVKSVTKSYSCRCILARLLGLFLLTAIPLMLGNAAAQSLPGAVPITVNLSASPALAAPGQVVTYTLTYKGAAPSGQQITAAAPSPDRTRSTVPLPQAAARGSRVAAGSSNLRASPSGKSVPYPVPHRSWIRLGIVAYQSPESMTQVKIDWAAQHIDWFDAPDPTLLPSYEAETDAHMFVYDNYYCLYVGGDKYNAMAQYATDHSIDVETMFVHFDTSTTITYGSETHTLSAGSRVPTYGWYGTGGDLTQNDARVVMNVHSADYRAFNVQYALSLVTTDHGGGATYDGIFIDNSSQGMLTDKGGTVTSGGTFAEYSGMTRAQASTAYDNDMVQAFSNVRTAFAGSKLQSINNGNYDSNWTAALSYVDLVFREFYIGSSITYRQGWVEMMGVIGAAHTAGAGNVFTTGSTGSTSTDVPDYKMAALAVYYAVGVLIGLLLPTRLELRGPSDLDVVRGDGVQRWNPYRQHLHVLLGR